MKTLLAASAAIVALGATAANAQSMPAQPYINLGAGYTFDDIEVFTGVARVGVNLGANFGLEAEGQIGLDDDTIGATSVDIDHILAAFARVRGQVGPNTEIFGRIGYYTSESTATTGAVSVSGDDDDFAAGFGAQFGLGSRTGLRLDYTNFGFDTDSNQVTATLVVNF